MRTSPQQPGVPSFLTKAINRGGWCAAQPRMHGGGFLCTFRLSVVVTSSILFSIALAAGIFGWDESSLTPGEPRLQTAGRSDIERYFTNLARLEGEACKKARLSPEEELGMLKESCNDGWGTGLVRLWVNDSLRAEAEGTNGKMVEGQGIRKMTLGRSLNNLVSRIYFEGGWNDVLVRFNCENALVADERLDAAAWEGYVDATVEDIACGAIAEEAAAGRLWEVVKTAAGLGLLEVIRTIVARAEKANVGIDLAAKKNAIFLCAIAHGQKDLIDFLREKKAKRPDWYGEICL